MKSITLLCLLLALTYSDLVSLNPDCPPQQVANANHICILVDYNQGCTVYKNKNECLTCAKEYELIKGKCSLTDSNVDIPASLVGCLVSNGNTCSNCANGFRLVNQGCVAGVEYCLDYDDRGLCAHCDSEYSLIFGECRHNLMLGCKVEQSDHSCTECFKPFLLQNYQCVIPNCKSYNDYGCYACECGYYLNEGRSCTKIANGCLKFYRGNCVECLPHYKLKGGVCAIDGCLDLSEGLCTLCKDNYTLVEGSCVFKNCYDWKDDSCLICNSGFNLVHGKCVASTGNFVCSA